jgi:ribosomal protein S9
MKEGFLNTIREYLLTFDENIRERIRISLTEDDFVSLSNIENAFLSDKHINAIIQELQLESIQEEIKDLHAEYYLELSELYAEGQTNKEIETLLSSDNQTFKKTVSLFPDETTFFKELSIAVDDKKTEQLKKGYAEIDEWLQSKKSTSNKDVESVVSIRRKIFHYAIAAIVVGVLIGGVYLRFFNTKLSDDNAIVNNDTINNNKPDIADLELPNLIESKQSNKPILIDKQGSGFAGNFSTYDSINIQTNGLSNQIDALRRAIAAKLEKNDPKNNSELNKSYIMISRKIDSLENILNTYTYDYETKRVVLNFPIANKVKNVISKNPKDLSKFYLNVENNYYLIKATETPFELKLITDKEELEKLKRIEFSNE